MKILSKNKIIVSALALCIGASLTGSISGTIAWYQYSTRANVSFIGKSGGFSGNLQMRFVDEADDDNAWRTRITWQEMNNNLLANGYALQGKVVPMTYGAMGRDSELPANGYVQPLLGKASMANWTTASKKHYAQFKLQLRYNERDGVEEGEGNAAKDEKNVEKKVYLSKLVLQEDLDNARQGKSDLSNALRVHISSNYKEINGEDGEGNPTYSNALGKNKLISKVGGTILTQGKLDLDNDGKPDQGYPNDDEFGFDYNRNNNNSITYDESGNPTRVGLTDVVYGGGIQTSYAAKAEYSESDKNHKYLPYGKEAESDKEADPIYPALAGVTGNKLDNLDFDHDGDGDGEGATPRIDKFIGKTVEKEDEYLTVTVTVWVEGWQELENSAIWDVTKYVDSSFNVGIQFAVEDASF